MDKQRINLDQLYQERFQSFEMETSSNASANMKSKLKMAKTMQTIKWIIAGAITVAAITTITLFTLKKNDSITQENTVKEENTNIENTQKLNNKTNNQSYSSQKKDMTPSVQINEELENSHTKVLESSSKEHNTHLNSIEEGAVNADDTEQAKVSNQISNTQSQSESNEKQVYTEENKIENPTIENARIKEESTIIQTTDSGKTNIDKEYNSNENTQSQNHEPIEKKSTSMEEHTLVEEVDGLSILETKKSFIPEIDEELEIAKKETKLKSRNWLGASKAKFSTSKNSDLQKMSPGNGGNKLDGFFGVHFSPIYWNNQANWDSPVLDTSWTSSLHNKPQLSYEFGFSFQLHHQDLPLFLQFGLDYQILKEKIDYNFIRRFEDPDLSYWDFDSLWSVVDVLDTFYIIVDSNQFVIDSIFTQDTLLNGIDSSYNAVISKEEKNKTNVNTYRYLNIPLLLGYQFQSRNQKWNYQIMAGAAIAINLKNDGYYYTSSGGIESYSGKVSPDLVWNLYAAANINYRWKKWRFFAQPEFQYQLNESRYSQGIPIRKYQFYKLKVGIRYQLF